MLHIVTQSPANTALATQLSTNISEQDEVILIQDAVYYLLNPQSLNSIFSSASHVYYLNTDAQARGIQSTGQNANACNYEQFVGLTLKHSNNQTW
ncbi:sulfurtransferase complex subunit TusB [Neptunicella marina]|uniref:Sulfurtransferase complex subunit TusB n=1 Tax=Neptunicella marina TaxID=2125989 RepID=A0A8J6M1U9_9ALTE|nr:sulfurtransferase complex subunit TusB [Neptunicella marina]MBC3767754.1 sulfurtransferase complex subunit TusB [Neptunicella marina]